jgi:hypothetical protein
VEKAFTVTSEDKKERTMDRSGSEMHVILEIFPWEK